MVACGAATTDSKRIRDEFSTKDFNIDLDIKHDFWKNSLRVDKFGWLGSSIYVKNTGDVALENIKLYVSLDDNSDDFEAHICDPSTGQILDKSCSYITLEVGDLAPNEETRTGYCWIVAPEMPDPQAEGTPREVYIKIKPHYSVNFQRSNKTFRSVSILSNA